MEFPGNFLKDNFSWSNIRKIFNSMKTRWNNLPEQIKRITVIVVIFFASLILLRNFMMPDDFGRYGHYRASAVDSIVSHNIHYAGQALCAECHDDIMEIKSAGFHRTVACEVCHGPGSAHTEDPEGVTLDAPRQRAACPLCHEYLPSRPTGFPQILSASHNPMNPCITCHEPHEPEPPETPKECAACHAEIARTKMVSHHVYVPCIHCHITPEEHKLHPRDILPSKPKSREFCGKCHDENADSAAGIPRIDLSSHETRYVCWQCHYPHLPEAN